MIYVLGYLAFAAGLIVFLRIKKLDWSKSSVQSLHLPPDEINPVSNAEDGYFSYPAAIRNSIIAIAATGAIAIGIPLWSPTFLEFHFLAPFVSAAILFGWAGVIWASISGDIKRMRSRLDRQKSLLERIKANPENASALLPMPKLQSYIERPKKWVIDTFYDFGDAPQIDIPEGFTDWDDPEEYAMFMGELNRADQAIVARLTVLATQIPPADWLKTDRDERVARLMQTN